MKIRAFAFPLVCLTCHSDFTSDPVISSLMLFRFYRPQVSIRFLIASVPERV
jgi:hypothetical protein